MGHVGVHGEGDLAALMALIHPDIPDAGGLYAQDGDAAPDAGVGETGAPVPAEHAVGLADGGEAHHGIGGAVGGILLIGLADIFGRGVEGDGDLVFPCPECGLHIVLPGSVHIVGSAHRDAVDGDGGQGVQTLAAEQHLVAAWELRADLEAAAVDKGVLHQLQGFHFIVPVEGVGDQLCGVQVVIHGAGDDGIHLGKSAFRNGELPGAVQGKNLHRITSCF